MPIIIIRCQPVYDWSYLKAIILIQLGGGRKRSLIAQSCATASIAGLAFINEKTFFGTTSACRESSSTRPCNVPLPVQCEKICRKWVACLSVRLIVISESYCSSLAATYMPQLPSKAIAQVIIVADYRCWRFIIPSLSFSSHTFDIDTIYSDQIFARWRRIVIHDINVPD